MQNLVVKQDHRKSCSNYNKQSTLLDCYV